MLGFGERSGLIECAGKNHLHYRAIAVFCAAHANRVGQVPVMGLNARQTPFRDTIFRNLVMHCTLEQAQDPEPQKA